MVGSMFDVAVIIPLGTDRGYFYDALDSAINQDFNKRRYEIIIINDNVPSITLKNIQEYLKKYNDYPNVYFYNVDFNQLSKVINFGINKSKSKYYTVLPDDDRILPEKLSTLFNELETTEYDVVFSLAYKINANGERLGGFPKNLKYAKNHPILKWKHIENGDGLLVNGISTMYSVSSSKDVGNWDENLFRAEEWEFHLRLLKNGYDMKFVNEYTTEYRVHNSNKSRRKDYSFRKEQLKYIYCKLQIGNNNGSKN